MRPPEWYADHEVDARFGTRAVQLDARDREVVLAGGERVGFDRLLVATGRRNRTLDVPGADLPGRLRPAPGGRCRSRSARRSGAVRAWCASAWGSSAPRSLHRCARWATTSRSSRCSRPRSTGSSAPTSAGRWRACTAITASRCNSTRRSPASRATDGSKPWSRSGGRTHRGRRRGRRRRHRAVGAS